MCSADVVHCLRWMLVYLRVSSLARFPSQGLFCFLSLSLGLWSAGVTLEKIPALSLPMCVCFLTCVCRSAEYGRTCRSIYCDSCRVSRCASAWPRRRAEARTWRGRSSNTELCLPVRLAAARLAICASAARRRRTRANEADEKVNIYGGHASLHHSRVISANPAWIKVG